VKSSVAQPPEQEQTVQNVFSLNLGLWHFHWCLVVCLSF
jgi:hypothetical protein